MKKLQQRLENWLISETPLDGPPLCDFQRIRREIKPCDVLLIEGRSRVARVIRKITHSPWTHAIFYLGRLCEIDEQSLRTSILEHYHNNNLPPPAESEPLIIESELGLGTVVRSLTAYEDEHIRICRPTGLKRTDSQESLRFACSRLGHAYDTRQIFDLLRFLLPYSFIPRHWRSSLFNYLPGKATKTVCSTLIAEAFSVIHFPVLPLVGKDRQQRLTLFHRNPKLCIPADFDYSPYFQIIKCPLITFNGDTCYRSLPWGDPGSNISPEIKLISLGSGAIIQLRASSHLLPVENLITN